MQAVLSPRIILVGSKAHLVTLAHLGTLLAISVLGHTSVTCYLCLSGPTLTSALHHSKHSLTSSPPARRSFNIVNNRERGLHHHALIPTFSHFPNVKLVHTLESFPTTHLLLISFRFPNFYITQLHIASARQCSKSKYHGSSHRTPSPCRYPPIPQGALITPLDSFLFDWTLTRVGVGTVRFSRESTELQWRTVQTP